MSRRLSVFLLLLGLVLPPGTGAQNPAHRIETVDPASGRPTARSTTPTP